MSQPDRAARDGLAAGMRRIRPGWYLLAALSVYAVVVTALVLGRGGGAGDDHAASTTASTVDDAGRAGVASPGAAANAPVAAAAATTEAPPGLWFPIPGARLPTSDDNLPGAPRAYRRGVSQGFDFHDGDAGVPITFGTPVVAAAAGSVVRADTAYVELDARAWQDLLDAVAEGGADEPQLDRLRGRQLWIRTADGTVLRYGHLSSVRDGVRVGSQVYRGQVVGYVGNSGTDDGVAGRRDGARLRFEIWSSDDTFFGEGLDPTQVRLRAASLFAGP